MFTIWITDFVGPKISAFNGYLIKISEAPIKFVILLINSILNIKIALGLIFLFIFVAWAVYKIMKLILLSRSKLRIIKAEYGSDAVFTDITNHLNNYIIDNKLNISLSNGIPGFDPTPGVIKIGKVKYIWNNKIFEKKYIENNIIDLP